MVPRFGTIMYYRSITRLSKKKRKKEAINVATPINIE